MATIYDIIILKFNIIKDFKFSVDVNLIVHLNIILVNIFNLQLLCCLYTIVDMDPIYYVYAGLIKMRLII